MENLINLHEPLRIHVDDGLLGLMAGRKFSIVLTIAPDGLLLLGLTPEGKLNIEHLQIDHAFSVAFDRNRLAVSNRREIIVYGNSALLAPEHPDYPNRYDAFFTPQVTFFTGDCMVHDMVIAPQGIVVANTRFSTVCLIDGQYNFNPIWHPSFITAPMPEDRCHLNGIAVVDNQLRYATAFGAFNQATGWRNKEASNGVLVDVVRDCVLIENLCLPHSPRLFDGRLFVLESGFGAVLEIDPVSGERRCLAKLPGLTRGLCSDRDTLFVGLSHRRPSRNKWNLPIDNLNTPLKAGVVAMDINSGEVLGTMKILSNSREVLDVKLLPNIACPGIVDTRRSDSYHLIDSPAGSYWLKSVLSSTIDSDASSSLAN